MKDLSQEVSLRHLRWVETESVKGWGCAHCSWIFHPPEAMTGKTIDEMKSNFKNELFQAFDSHRCQGQILRQSATGTSR
jgi:hypothetical protein